MFYKYLNEIKKKKNVIFLDPKYIYIYNINYIN